MTFLSPVDLFTCIFPACWYITYCLFFSFFPGVWKWDSIFYPKVILTENITAFTWDFQ